LKFDIYHKTITNLKAIGLAPPPYSAQQFATVTKYSDLLKPELTKKELLFHKFILSFVHCRRRQRSCEQNVIWNDVP